MRWGLVGCNASMKAIIIIITRSKDPVEDIVVLSAGTIFVIRQRLALKRDY